MVLNEASVPEVHQVVGVFAREKRTSVRTLSPGLPHVLTTQAIIQLNIPVSTFQPLLFLTFPQLQLESIFAFPGKQATCI